MRVRMMLAGVAAAGFLVFALIEKLSRLHGLGALTDAEYNAKKNELLSRI